MRRRHATVAGKKIAGLAFTLSLRPLTPLSREDARRIVANFVTCYNAVRLDRALGYVTPKDKLEGRAAAILAARERKLPAARERRARMRRGTCEKRWTGGNEENKVPGVGETEAGKAGERPARDSRPGRRITGVG